MVFVSWWFCVLGCVDVLYLRWFVFFLVECWVRFVFWCGCCWCGVVICLYLGVIVFVFKMCGFVISGNI